VLGVGLIRREFHRRHDNFWKEYLNFSGISFELSQSMGTDVSYETVITAEVKRHEKNT
jgi:hypothetical protein